MSNTISYRLLPLLMMILFIAACAPAPDLRDDNFLSDTALISGDPCSAPCWQNLTPGETAWGVAQDLIDTRDDYVEVDSGRDRRTREEWIEFAFQDGLECCRLYTADGETLTSILLLLAPETTVSRVIETSGEPAYITAQEETSEQAYVALVYPDVAMVVYAFAENVTTDEITEDNDVVGVIYMASSEMETLLQTESLYLWDGYGTLGDIIDGEFDLTPVPQDENEDPIE